MSQKFTARRPYVQLIGALTLGPCDPCFATYQLNNWLYVIEPPKLSFRGVMSVSVSECLCSKWIAKRRCPVMVSVQIK